MGGATVPLGRSPGLHVFSYFANQMLGPRTYFKDKMAMMT